MLFKRGALLILVLVSALCSVIAYQTLQDRSVSTPPGSTVAFRITDWNGDRTSSEIREMIHELANASNVVVAQVVQDPSNPRASRLLYRGVADSTLHSSPNFSLPPDFGSLMRTQVKQETPSHLSPIGEWSGWGSRSQLQNFLKQLTSKDISADTVNQPTELPSLAALSPASTQVYACLVLLVIGLAIAMTVASQRALAVQQLLGTTFSAKLRRLLAPPICAFVGMTLAIGIAEIIFCYVLYSGAYIGELVGQTGLLACVLLLVLILGATFTTLLYHHIAPLPALGGATPGRSILLTSWILHALLLVTVAGLGATALEANHRQENFETYAEQIRGENLSAVQFGGVYNPKQESEVGAIVNSWVAQLEERGQSLIVKLDQSADANSSGTLYVNDTYLQRNPASVEIYIDNPQSVHVYVPESITNDAFQTALDDISFEANKSPESIEVHHVTRTGSFRTFTEPSASSTTPPVVAHDPILVVLPHGSQAASEFALSGNGLYILDGGRALASASTVPGLQRYLRSITPLSVIADQSIARASAEKTSAISAFLTGLVALTIVTITGVVSYGQYAHRRLKVQYLLGYHVTSMYIWFILLEAVTLAVLGGWTITQLGAYHADMDSVTLSGAGEPSSPFFAGPASVVAALVSLSIFMLSTLLVHRHLIKKGNR